jgi:hypothetical protein
MGKNIKSIVVICLILMIALFSEAQNYNSGSTLTNQKSKSEQKIIPGKPKKLETVIEVA